VFNSRPEHGLPTKNSESGSETFPYAPPPPCLQLLAEDKHIPLFLVTFTPDILLELLLPPFFPVATCPAFELPHLAPPRIAPPPKDAGLLYSLPFCATGPLLPVIVV